jgi:diguanylate cyclase (GGDEF)-like protein/PAS domain S-box-containing protein
MPGSGWLTTRSGKGRTVVPPRRGEARAAYAYLVVGAGLAVAYFRFPEHHLWLWAPLGLSAFAATIVGVRRNRPSHPLAWCLLGAGLLSFATGDTVYNVLTDVFHQEDPYPSLADVFYLAMYPLIVGGLVVMIRARTTTRDWASMIDALTLATGMGLLSWVYLIAPYLADTQMSWQARATSVAYPVADVVVLASLARLAANGLRLRSMQLLMVAGIGLLVSDVGYGWAQLNSEWTVGGPIDVGWVVCYLACGAAALHPSMREVSRPQPPSGRQLRIWQVLALGTVSLIAPTVLAVESARQRGDHSLGVAVFSAALYVLVISRLAGIVAVHQQSVTRERVLRRYGEALVSARTADLVHAATLSAVCELTVDRRVLVSGLHLLVDGQVTQVAPEPAGEPSVRAHWPVALSGGDLLRDGTLSVSPLRYDDDTSGMLVVAFARPVPTETHLALSTVAAQAALALRGLQLSEEARRRQQDAQFKALIQNASDLLVVVAADGAVTYASPSVERRLGWPVAALRGRPVYSLLTAASAEDARLELASLSSRAGGSRAVADWAVRHADGQLVSFEVVIQQLLDDANVAGLVLTMRDVSERRELERQLTHQAFHDALTGLPNRTLFNDRAEHALRRTRARGGRMAMLMLDLDEFKLINDTLGHGAGDEFLVAVAAYLSEATPEGGTIARLGGDEFAMLLEDLTDADEAHDVAQRVIARLSEPFIVQDCEVRAGGSCGLVTVDSSDTGVASVQELLRNADLALYEAKQRGRGVVVGYHPALEARLREKVTRKSDLRRALDAGEFCLHYQPIVDLESGRITGAEALVRWMHPDRGLLGPVEFIPAAEESGLIVDLGRWVLGEATRQAAGWAGHVDRLYMSVNVSPRQLQQSSFISEVAAILDRHPQLRNNLVLEITESTLMQDGPAIPDRMHTLHQLGALIAIDDFGVGYSSLGYLQRLPIDILKIDKSFVDNLGRNDGNGGVLAHAVVSLAHALRLRVVAEGIEQQSQHDELRALGCHYGQGYLFSRPVPPDAFEALLGLAERPRHPVPGPPAVAGRVPEPRHAAHRAGPGTPRPTTRAVTRDGAAPTGSSPQPPPS